VENHYLSRLQGFCRREIEERQDALVSARGFLGIGADWEEVKKIQARKLESCEKLRSLGYSVRY
jgi:DnaJ homolog subfamily B member 12